MSSETDTVILPQIGKRTAKSFNGAVPVKRVALSDISNSQSPILVKDTAVPTATQVVKKEKKKSLIQLVGQPALQVRSPMTPIASTPSIPAVVTAEIEELKKKLEDEKERVREYQKQGIENEEKMKEKNEQMEALKQNMLFMTCYNEHMNPSSEAAEPWTMKEISAHIAVVQHLMKRDAQLTKKLASNVPEDIAKKLVYLKELQSIKNSLELYGGLSSTPLE